MRTMVDFSNEKLIILAKESTQRGRNAQKEIDRRKAAGTFKDPAEVVEEKPKTRRRRKKTVKSEVTVKSEEGIDKAPSDD